MKIDLHTHTTYSDGNFDVWGNAIKAYDYKLNGIAITDHDNIDSWDDIDKFGDLTPVFLIKGVELSTRYNGDSVHVLGYYLNDDGNYDELVEHLEQAKADRIERLDKILFLLDGEGFYLDKDEILINSRGSVSRSHIAKALLQKYPDSLVDKDDVFNKLLGNHACCYVPINDYSTEEGIKLLQRNHCLSVLAHPLYITKFDYRELLKLGIDGIEVFYTYRGNLTDDVLSFAKENNLVVTGGSDYHGKLVYHNMGKDYVSGEYEKQFVKRINYKIF